MMPKPQWAMLRSQRLTTLPRFGWLVKSLRRRIYKASADSNLRRRSRAVQVLGGKNTEIRQCLLDSPSHLLWVLIEKIERKISTTHNRLGSLNELMPQNRVRCQKSTRLCLPSLEAVITRKRASHAGLAGVEFFEPIGVCHLLLFILPNVKAHPPLGARASVEHGVEVGVIIKACKQGGS